MTLSPRELQVLRLVANGLVNSEIARRLHIAEETVKSHVRTLLRKLEARLTWRAGGAKKEPFPEILDKNEVIAED